MTTHGDIHGAGPGVQPAERLRGVHAYSAAARPWFITLKLDANEGPAPPASALAPLRWSEAPQLVQRYPTPADLEAFIAERYGVAPDRVLVTAGVDDALYRACQALLEPGREVVLSDPTFEMLPRYAALAGGGVRSVAWASGPFPLQATLAAIGPQTSMIVVVTPNNPTGLAATAADLQAIAAAAADAVLIVDLAYAEFADIDLTRAALQLPNAVVLRTLSKAWGLAGLRVGYAIGPARVTQWLRAAGNPFPTSGLSLLLARERLRAGWAPAPPTQVPAPTVGRASVPASVGQASVPATVGQASVPASPMEQAAAAAAFPPLAGELQRAIEQVKAERAALAEQLARHGWLVAPSQANFILARSPRSAWLRDALRGMGIAIRAFPDRPGLNDAVRITCPGDPAAFARLLAAIDTALSPQVLLVDRTAVLSHGDVATWRALSGRLPLALLNERPRAEQCATLMRLGLSECFSVTVHEGDAPQSPEPAFLRLALRQLGSERAWVLSGRTEEMIAARAAGLTPIGLSGTRGPGEAATTQGLRDAGAARVVSDPGEILEWLT